MQLAHDVRVDAPRNRAQWHLVDRLQAGAMLGRIAQHAGCGQN
jgi:hypothetical protein